MADVGQQFWGRLWSPLYGFLGGNPLAAMPSLHFATSLMAAHVLSEAGPVAGAAGWTYAGALGFALVYLGEHYVVDLAAGAALAEGIRAAGPRATPALAAVARSVAALERRAAAVRAFRPGDRRGARALRRHRTTPPSARSRGGGGSTRPRAMTSSRACCSTGGGSRPTAVVVAVILVALYLVLPKLTGLEDSLRKIEDADPVWIAIALGFNVLSFAAYIALFRGILGGRRCSPQVRERIDWRTSYQITLAGLAATRLFSAGGAGGIALTYWALRRAGMGAREAARRMVAFLVLLYTVYLVALVVCGIFLRVGLFPGPSPVGMTIVPGRDRRCGADHPARVSLIPADLERIVARWAQGHRRVRLARRIASIPATIATGTREALSILRHPAAARSRSPARSDSGPRTSACCGPASTRSASRSRRPCWCRGSSSG